jgi:hypothetical protein
VTTPAENVADWADKIGKPIKETRVSTGAPKLSSTRAANAPKPKATGNETKASQAVEVLVSWNNGLAGAAMLTGMFETAVAITDREESFRESAFAALVVNEKLCQTIINMGGKSGVLGLALVYVALGVGVAPVAREEFKERSFNPKALFSMFKKDMGDDEDA